METDIIIKECQAQMGKAEEHTLNEFNALNTGKASPAMVESLPVEAYGSKVKLLEVAAITTPDPRTIRIQPWDKSVIRNVEKAIQTANLGLNPIIDGGIIRCPIPELSKDRRKEMVKIASGHAEHGRIGTRAGRRDAIDKLKKLQKNGDISEDDLKRLEKDIQKFTDDSINSINEHLKSKEKELMQL